jgi:hypothetical protein
MRGRAEGLPTTFELLENVRQVVVDESTRSAFFEIVDFEPGKDMIITCSEMAPFTIGRPPAEAGVRAA